jgi:2-hydroxychromene-2-carboxylate isomerase
MNRTIEFFLDVASPATYLAWTQIRALAERAGARVRYRPFLLGGVFKATGNTAPITVPAKGANLHRDLERYAEHYGVPFRRNPHFPMNSVMAMRVAVACTDEAELLRYLQAAFQAAWVDGRNIADEAVMCELLSEAGLDAAGLMARIHTPEVKLGLIQATEEAVQRGAFGAPSFFVGDELFFGQDRLPMVEKYARAAA